MGRRYSRGSDFGLGWILVLVFALKIMPFIGLYLIIKGKNDDLRAVGILVFIIGVVFWII